MGGIHRMKQTMKSCILEQPDTIRRVCQNAEKVCDSVYSIVGKGPFDKIYLIGSGTSLHTAIAAKYEELNQWKEYAASLSDKWRELIGEELYNQVSELFNY